VVEARPRRAVLREGRLVEDEEPRLTEESRPLTAALLTTDSRTASAAERLAGQLGRRVLAATPCRRCGQAKADFASTVVAEAVS
jgi:hypothetical protein